jgi:hypothetical protein
MGIRGIGSGYGLDIGSPRPLLSGKEPSNGPDREVEVIAIPVSTSTVGLSRGAQNNNAESDARAEARPKQATSPAAAVVARTPTSGAIGN